MPCNPLKHQRISAVLTRVEHRALRGEAARRGVSMAQLMRACFAAQLRKIVRADKRRKK